MKHWLSHHALCAVVIFLAQLFVVVHATQHELSAEGAEHCELCAVAHAAPMPSDALTFHCNISFDGTAVVYDPIDLSDRRPFDRPNTRGPPSLLV